MLSRSHWVSLNGTFVTFQSCEGDILCGSVADVDSSQMTSFVKMRLSVIRREIHNVAM